MKVSWKWFLEQIIIGQRKEIELTPRQLVDLLMCAPESLWSGVRFNAENIDKDFQILSVKIKVLRNGN